MRRDLFKTKDDEYAAQSTALAAYLRTNKVRFGLTDAQLDALDALITPFPPALDTFKASVLAERQNSVLKEDAKSVSRNGLSRSVDNLGDLFTNADRVANGMPELSGHGGPRPVPTETPTLVAVNSTSPLELLVTVLNSADLSKKGRPDDVDDAEIRWDVPDGVSDDDFDEWHPGPTPSDLRSPVRVKFKAALKGKTVHLIARYRNTNGDGPWSQIVSATIA